MEPHYLFSRTPLPPTNGACTSTRGHVTSFRSCSMNGLQKERDSRPLARSAAQHPPPPPTRHELFRRTLGSELCPPAHRPNWLCLGQYLTLLTHSNLSFYVPTTLSFPRLFQTSPCPPLHDPSLSPPLLPPDRRTSPGCRSSSGRAFIVYVLSTPCLHGTHRASLYSSPRSRGLRLSLRARTPNDGPRTTSILMCDVAPASPRYAPVFN